MDSERKLFDLRRTARLGQKDQLAAAHQAIAGADYRPYRAAGCQGQGNGADRPGTRRRARPLCQKNLVPLNRLTSLERDEARIQGERGQLIASAAEAKGKIAEIQLQILQVDQELSSDVAKELRETDSKIGEYVERKVTARRSAQAHRHPRAAGWRGVPVDRKHGRRRHHRRRSDHADRAGVGRPAVEVKVEPKDIDLVAFGQPVVLRFSAFNQRTTPELNGTVTRVAADTTPISAPAKAIIWCASR